jgi:hypothetical protein
MQSHQNRRVVRRIKPPTVNKNNPSGVVNVVAPWTNIEHPHHGQKSTSNATTRSFVFADIAKVDVEFGAPMTSLDQANHKMIKEQLQKRLCLRSDRRAVSKMATRRCRRNVEILRCVTCTNVLEGMWYSAVSQTGAVFGRVGHDSTDNSNSNQTLQIHFPNYNDGPYMYEKLDIAVPIAGQDEKLRKFVARLKPSIRQFRSALYGSKISIRLLISRFPFDNPSPNDSLALEAFRMNLTLTSGLTNLDEQVVFVPVSTNNNHEFNRAKAINALHQVAHHDDSSALAVIDVDLSVGPKFLRNALTFPFPQKAAYFPIMWSEFNPDSVEVVDQFFPSIKRYKFSIHHGHLRQFSYGMYVIAGSDAPRLTMDESFVGWYVTTWTKYFSNMFSYVTESS